MSRETEDKDPSTWGRASVSKLGALAPRPDWSELGESEHFVQFYEADAFLLESLAGYVESGLTAGNACIVIATQAHLAALEDRLRADGLDPRGARTSGQYIELNAADTLSRLMAEGRPDPRRFAESIGAVLARASEGGRRVRIFGEMVALLWNEGNVEAAIALEELWNGLRRKLPFSLLCGYPINAFSRQDLARPFNIICGQHSRVIPAEDYGELPSADDRLRAIAVLQHKARSLEKEISERLAVEDRLTASELHYKALFESSSDGILIVDPRTHKIRDANPAIAGLLGLAHDEFLGKELWEVGLLKGREASLEVFRQLNEGGGVVHYEHLTVGTSAGEAREVEVFANLLSANGHQIIQCNIRDITERKRSEAIKSHLAAIIESSDDAIVSKSLEGIILSWNRGAERIFGYSAEEAVGKPIHILIPRDRYAEEALILKRLTQGDRIDHFETVRVTKDGRDVYISLTVSPIKDRHGKVIAASKVARDITQRKGAEAEREELLARERAAREEAEAANRMKDEFLAMLSHELRTPLNSISGWVEILERAGSQDPMHLQAIQVIKRNTRQQTRIVEDILDVSRIVSGKLRIDARPIDLVPAINAAVDVVRVAADAKGVKLRFDVDTSVGIVAGDPNRLQQVVWNLLSNAIKFTPSGGQVTIRLEGSNDCAILTVSDSGEGIPSDFLPYVFDRFRQADASYARRHGGLGLGLAIVRYLIELHGGTVEAMSEGPGLGATFRIKLPVAVSKHSALQHLRGGSAGRLPAESADLPRLAGFAILIVDDDQDWRELVTSYLGSQGAIVRSADGVAEATEILEFWEPDVLISDIGMPDEDGFALIRYLRSRSRASMPAVALSGYASSVASDEATSAGYDIYLAKPIELKALEKAIIRLVKRSVAR